MLVSDTSVTVRFTGCAQELPEMLMLSTAAGAPDTPNIEAQELVYQTKTIFLVAPPTFGNTKSP